mmetsp:Transcript_10918/g.32891  ORF Transcript_10918/g.32891 Transcript_10918/m.32891 type:complete len:233 (+) Transcript_10918:181-879(+)
MRTAGPGTARPWVPARRGSSTKGEQGRLHIGSRGLASAPGRTAQSRAAASRRGSSASRRTIIGPPARTCAFRVWTPRTGTAGSGSARPSAARRRAPRTGRATEPRRGCRIPARRPARTAPTRAAARTPACSASGGTTTTPSASGPATPAPCTRTRLARTGTAPPWAGPRRGECRPRARMPLPRCRRTSGSRRSAPGRPRSGTTTRGRTASTRGAARRRASSATPWTRRSGCA